MSGAPSEQGSTVPRVKPPRCPRCGNEDMTLAQVNHVRTNGEYERFAVYACHDCGMSYDEEKEEWRDEDDRPWVMAESGT